MDPRIWGPPAWKFLHCITLGYPSCPSNTDKQNISQFFANLHTVLPCAVCKKHFKDHFSKYPLSDDILNDKKKLFIWLVNVRNSVNRQNKKPEVSYKAVLQECVGSTTPTPTLITILIIAIVILIFILIYVTRRINGVGSLVIN